MNKICKDRSLRLSKWIAANFRWTLQPEVVIDDNTIKVSIFFKARYKNDAEGALTKLIQVLSLLQEQFEIEPKIYCLDHELKVEYNKTLAALAKIQYDSFSTRPVPILFKALEDVPPTAEELERNIKTQLEKSLAISCNEPTLRIKLVTTNVSTILVKFDGRQQAKIEKNLPKLTILSPLEDKHIISKWSLDYEANGTYHNYYKKQNDSKRKKYLKHYFLCNKDLHSLLATARELGLDVEKYAKQSQKHTELSRVGC